MPAGPAENVHVQPAESVPAGTSKRAPIEPLENPPVVPVENAETRAETAEEEFFFLFIHYSHATCQIMARLRTVRFSSAVRAVAAHCKLPFALRPGLSYEVQMHPKKILTKEAETERNVLDEGNGRERLRQGE